MSSHDALHQEQLKYNKTNPVFVRTVQIMVATKT